jgi:Putative peptidoglycan binding domain
MRYVFAASVCILCWNSAVFGQPAMVQGFVYSHSSCAGISRLIVTMTPPVATQLKESISVTDENGLFSFSGLNTSKYLVTVKFGIQPVYRNVHAVTSKTFLNIGLTDRGGESQESSRFEVKLGKGVSGPEVLLLQTRLTELKYYHGPQDGFFGAELETAVKAFQKEHHIKADGNLRGNRSWMAIVCAK